MADPKAKTPGANTLVIMFDSTSLLPGTVVPMFQKMSHLPDVSLTTSAVYHDDNLLGRSEPFKSYSFSTSTQITFTGLILVQGSTKDRNVAMEIVGGGLGLTGRFVSATMPFIGPAGKLISAAMNAGKDSKIQEILVSTTFQEVTLVAAWFESLTKPQYDDQGYAYPPPHVFLMHGQNFKRRGVITNVHLTYKGPWEVTTLLSMLVEISLTFQEDNKTPKGFLDTLNMKEDAIKKEAIEERYSGAQKAIDNARSLSGL